MALSGAVRQSALPCASLVAFERGNAASDEEEDEDQRQGVAAEGQLPLLGNQGAPISGMEAAPCLGRRAPCATALRRAALAATVLATCTAFAACLAVGSGRAVASGHTVQTSPGRWWTRVQQAWDGSDAGAGGGMLSARALFESEKLHEVATDNLMEVGRAFFRPDDRPLVQAAVGDGFRNLTAGLWAHSPQAAQALDRIWLREEQQAAALDMMRAMGDPRVQSLGLCVAQAIHESKADDEDIQQHVDMHLQARLQEVRKLQDELIPKQIRAGRQQKGHRWTSAVDPASVVVMASVSDKWDRQINAGAGVAPHEDLDVFAPRPGPSTLFSRNPFIRRQANEPRRLKIVSSISAAVSQQAKAFLATIESLQEQKPTAMLRGGARDGLEEGRELLDGPVLVSASVADGLPRTPISCELNVAERSGMGGISMEKVTTCLLKLSILGMNALSHSNTPALYSERV
mmetsp:Transcript_11388/g.25297  ORF Transcript_11388/g.25297 Transcript_11388/m.25297 type:complete len:460 (-) Transcript_11388:55-1434(-)